MTTQASKGKSVWVVGFLWARKFRWGERRVMSYPEPLYPCWALPGLGKTDKIHVELEGTRILRSSGVTPHRQTVIIINNSNFSLNYMMCVEVGRRGEKQSQRRGTYGRRENTG